MLVYMEVASDVNSLAEGGKGGKLWSEVRTSYEFFYVGWHVGGKRLELGVDISGDMCGETAALADDWSEQDVGIGAFVYFSSSIEDWNSCSCFCAKFKVVFDDRAKEVFLFS